MRGYSCKDALASDLSTMMLAANLVLGISTSAVGPRSDLYKMNFNELLGNPVLEAEFSNAVVSISTARAS